MFIMYVVLFTDHVRVIIIVLRLCSHGKEVFCNDEEEDEYKESKGGEIKNEK